jgi:hypothetical protein
MCDSAFNGLYRVLDFDERLTHIFRVTARAFLRQCRRGVSTIFNLSIPRGNQFLNVLIFQP